MRQNVGYQVLLQTHPKELVDQVLSVLELVFGINTPKLTLDGEIWKTHQARSMILDLDHDRADYLCRRMNKISLEDSDESILNRALCLICEYNSIAGEDSGHTYSNYGEGLA